MKEAEKDCVSMESGLGPPIPSVNNVFLVLWPLTLYNVSPGERSQKKSRGDNKI